MGDKWWKERKINTVFTPNFQLIIFTLRKRNKKLDSSQKVFSFKSIAAQYFDLFFIVEDGYPLFKKNHLISYLIALVKFIPSSEKWESYRSL